MIFERIQVSTNHLGITLGAVRSGVGTYSFFLSFFLYRLGRAAAELQSFLMMMIAFITFKSSLVPLFEGL